VTDRRQDDDLDDGDEVDRPIVPVGPVAGTDGPDAVVPSAEVAPTPLPGSGPGDDVPQ
jgi:hypothetical protein